MRNLSYYDYADDGTASTSLVCYDCRGNGTGAVVPTIAGDHNSRVGDYAGVVVHSRRIRRLTPLECERLQGYPDGWTDIPGASDTRRYKALGNSIAIPFWQHLMLRVSKHCKDKTLASLFDGIGGFPLCWERAGGVTLWSSEIDPFPASVSDAHFLSI